MKNSKFPLLKKQYSGIIDSLGGEVLSMASGQVNDNGIIRLMNANSWGGPAFHNFGWNPRPIEGTDHFVFYSLAYHTKKSYIHGPPVNMGVYVGSLLHNSKAEEMVN